MVRMYRDDTPSLNCSGLEDHLMGSGRFVSDSILPSAGIQTEVLQGVFYRHQGIGWIHWSIETVPFNRKSSMTIKHLDFRVESMWMKPHLFGITLLYTDKPFKMGWNHQMDSLQARFFALCCPRKWCCLSNLSNRWGHPTSFRNVSICVCILLQRFKEVIRHRSPG